MIFKRLLCFFAVFVLLNTPIVKAQSVKTLEVIYSPNEQWWGGAVALGSKMPYIKPLREFDLSCQNDNNQIVPLFLSSKGRYFWSDKPFSFEITDNKITVKSSYEDIKIQQAGNTLREAYLEASKKYFPSTGTLPEHLFFSEPQYNTWIELMYNQNEQDILKYAQAILDNGFPSGVLMIDDNWQRYYGNFDFRAEKFSDPKGMVDKLHKMGFKVMLWICPFVSSDSQEYRDLLKKGYLIKAKGSIEPAVISWWNGKSACYDLTNPEAKQYFIDKLKFMQTEYGIDGFKFDAGDTQFYDENYIDSYKNDAISVDHTKAWAEIGLSFPYNEYRAGWKMGGQPLVQRLGDKNYSWGAVQMLIPDMIAAGLMGYAYSCPDMVGGGEFSSFLNIKEDQFDQKLIVRSAQVHALMPMMQFSVAPWRILNKENLEITQKMALLHQQFGAYILDCAKASSKSGEPIIRHMEYSFPNEGFEFSKDQFMLGDKYLVAPVVTSNDTRKVKLPKGKWKDDLGKVINGGRTIEIKVPISRLPYYEKL
jgi:alpha-glucosidase (family GH31 glycosyl hydrolase)